MEILKEAIVPFDVVEDPMVLDILFFKTNREFSFFGQKNRLNKELILSQHVR